MSSHIDLCAVEGMHGKIDRMTRGTNRLVYPICCHASSSQLCHASPPLRKGRCANSFSERIHATRIGHSALPTKTLPSAYSTTPLSNVARSCKTTRHSPFIARAGVPHSAPRSPSKSPTDSERTQTPDLRTKFFSTHCCAPHLHRGATESSSL